MFITNAKLEYYIKLQDDEIRRIERKIWDIQGKHERLLAHLGLQEVTSPQITELRTKGGPERGE